MGRRRASLQAWPVRALLAGALALATALPHPSVAAAHPLGNFTVNHYAGMFIEPERVLLDVVIDQAEIPTFTARQLLDTDGDGSVSDAEVDVARVTECESLAKDLDLRVDDERVTLVLVEAGIDFPPGAGGLPTMRTVCGYVADLPEPLAIGGPAAQLTFQDGSYPARLGWREMVVTGSGVDVVPGPNGEDVRQDSPTGRLTTYPEDMIARPLDERSLAVTIEASAVAPVRPRPNVPDAAPVPVAPILPPPVEPGGDSPTSPAPSASGTPAVPEVPGGIGTGDVPSIFREADLTPVVLMLSVLTAVALGAGHALTPGHGKTLMAAYLVGTRGRPLHAVGLGLSVSVSHTAGILVLAALIVGASDVLPADVVVRAAPVVASVSIMAIGAWMLAGEWRRRRSATATATAAHDHAAAHEHPHGDHHVHGDEHAAAHDHAGAHEHSDDEASSHVAGEHSHGGVRHSHLPPTGATITWRSLFVLGLAGGLIPSTSALLILLGSIAAGRAAFGMVLVVAFGLGMAAVMTGIGLVLVVARERLDRVPTSAVLRRAREAVPLVAACIVFGFGIYLTVQALAGAPTL